MLFITACWMERCSHEKFAGLLRNITKPLKTKLGGGNSNIFGIFTPKIGGRWTHFDEHILQMGWFNHQLLLGQWLNFKLFGITYLVRKIKFKLFFQGPLAKWELEKVKNRPKHQQLKTAPSTSFGACVLARKGAERRGSFTERSCGGYLKPKPLHNCGS